MNRTDATRVEAVMSLAARSLRLRLAVALAVLSAVALGDGIARGDEGELGAGHEPPSDGWPPPPPHRPPAVAPPPKPPVTVSWWEGRALRGEVGAGAFASFFFPEHGSAEVSGGGRASAGVRYQRAPSGPSGGLVLSGGDVLDGLFSAAIGDQFGLDARASLLGVRDGRALIAGGIAPAAYLLLPPAGENRVAGRLETFVGALLPEVGIATDGRDVGFHLALDWSATILVRPGLGFTIDVAGGRTFLDTSAPTYVRTGIGLMFR